MYIYVCVCIYLYVCKVYIQCGIYRIFLYVKNVIRDYVTLLYVFLCTYICQVSLEAYRTTYATQTRYCIINVKVGVK